jgi:hypothetical protein
MAFMIAAALSLPVALYIIRVALSISALIVGVRLPPFLSAFAALLLIDEISLITLAMVFPAPSSLAVHRKTDLLRGMINRRREYSPAIATAAVCHRELPMESDCLLPIRLRMTALAMQIRPTHERRGGLIPGSPTENNPCCKKSQPPISY